ncbi:hypothetical protein KEM55_005378, partial [Ascosphaera atra]
PSSDQVTVHPPHPPALVTMQPSAPPQSSLANPNEYSGEGNAQSNQTNQQPPIEPVEPNAAPANDGNAEHQAAHQAAPPEATAGTNDLNGDPEEERDIYDVLQAHDKARAERDETRALLENFGNLFRNTLMSQGVPRESLPNDFQSFCRRLMANGNALPPTAAPPTAAQAPQQPESGLPAAQREVVIETTPPVESPPPSSDSSSSSSSSSSESESDAEDSTSDSENECILPLMSSKRKRPSKKSSSKSAKKWRHTHKKKSGSSRHKKGKDSRPDRYTAKAKDLSEKLSDRDGYEQWLFAVYKKFQDDAPLYPTDAFKIRYALNYLEGGLDS